MSSVISSLAILKVEWDVGRDYIQSFLPFVLESLRSAESPFVSLTDVQTFIREEFGLRIPQGALRTILHRAVKSGYVYKSEDVYHIVKDSLKEDSLRKRRADVIRQQLALVDDLVKFVAEEHSIDWSTQVAENALLSFIRQESIPILSAVLEGDPIVFAEQHDATSDYLVASFIRKIEVGDPESFKTLETLSKGTMLSSVLYFPSLGEVNQRFVDAKIVLDTPVILKALGLTVRDERVAYEEMIDLLYELNANVFCFEHTLHEIRGILHAASLALSTPSMLRDSRADATEFFLKSGSKSSDVEYILARLENHLANHHIRILPNPPYEATTTIDENRLGELLMDRVRYGQEKTMQHDLRAITSIFTLRRGEFPQDIEHCHAIFVTSNTTLVRSTSEFFSQQYGDDSLMVPLLIPHYTISTLAWLKKPMRSPDLPDRMISATCFAALNPPEMLWRLYLEEIEKLSNESRISEDDYYLLRFSSEARTLLMDKTLGEYNAFAEGTVLEILEHAKESVRHGIRQKYESERIERLRAEKERREYRSAVEFRIRKTSSGIAWVISRGLALIFGTALLLGSYYSFPGNQPFNTAPIRSILFALLALSTILTFLNAIFGTSLKSLVRTIENIINIKIRDLLLRYITGEQPGS